MQRLSSFTSSLPKAPTIPTIPNPLAKAPVVPQRKFIKEAPPNTENLPVRLVLCFDGTGDTAEGSFSAAQGSKSGTKDSIRTIFDLSKAGPVKDDEGKSMYQYVQYFEGVATINVDQKGWGIQAQALFDGATGNGYLDILRNGYKVCCQQLQHAGPGNGPNEIFIYGFSRGAFISRALTSFLQHVGIIKAEFLDKNEDEDTLFQEKFRQLLERYMKLTSKGMFTKATPTDSASELLPFCIPSPRVRVLGAFDTVKTVIPLPFHNYFKERIANIDFQMDAPGIVDHFRHALALNEARPLFNPDLWKSESELSNSSYLEAWFFGYHHDIGGGDAVQGLALWPLQWILHASIEHGLILDPTVEPYDILFTGADNVVETPHEIALKMFDMIRHHTEATKVWGLKLNEPFSLMSPRPREFFQFLTKPPYVKFVKPKVFIHPSAYLVFDVSSSFRIQVYQWKHFRKFLEDRFQALPQTTAPWWEHQTVDSILHMAESVECLNLLVIGRPKTGKETMITKIFGKPLGATDKGINTPVSIEGNNQVRVHYSTGFGKGGSDGREEVAKFLEDNRNNENLDEKIHAVWYFNDCSETKVEESEQELFNMEFGELPVLVVMQNEEKLRDSFREVFVDDEYNAEAKTLAEFGKAMDVIKSQIKLPKVGKYVQARNTQETPKNLLTETAVCFDHDAVNIAQIKAQRIEVKPKIALAAEESVRAYTIWYYFQTTGKTHSFGRNKDPAGMPLSLLLLEPVMTTFSMGFSGDAELIKSRVGAPWAALDKHTAGLCDKSLPGDLILISMLDTIMVMTYAISHRENPKNWKGEALPLTAADVEKACTWYTTPAKAGQETGQAALHRLVKELLAADGSPKDKSIANLQMKIIEVVELQAHNAENASSTIFGAMKDAISGWGGKFLGR
ncbi:Similar to hypothetical protein SNOG_14395 [Phaeosphaeria nodorum SN15]; acc. no. XP_001804583 [Pyronema omphalodes CBS 100304]|uniref:T6SS Phospholipase effector Tle1-like catalytic domain-containing protein n=1 Tax=Pyronema omphalodes (strain CBS 100304) TaxID=1076935 RepID=U4LJ52_PYROM|nr:Similar to hypothetical protein SNOG_14395 [Phaeosphaeria nodorum SN15]; acc. no. XP_001804583 [Pyronema omphalodes CBS 100304]